MAIYRLEMKTIGRSSGRSAVAAAAYRAGQSLHDERTGLTHDYASRQGVHHTEIVASHDVPEEFRERETLWNSAEAAENRKNARTAREIILALPHEVDDQERIGVARRFSQYVVDRYGVTVDMAVHAPDRHGDCRNHHAHLLFTTREVGPDGLEAKTRVLDDKTTGPMETEHLREMWAGFLNRSLERSGTDDRVDHRSLERQGIDREPEPKLGPVATQMERSGRTSNAGDDRRDVLGRNHERRYLDEQRKIIDLQIAKEEHRIKAEQRRSTEGDAEQVIKARQADDMATFYERVEQERAALSAEFEGRHGQDRSQAQEQANRLDDALQDRAWYAVLWDKLRGRLEWDAEKQRDASHEKLNTIEQEQRANLDMQEHDRLQRLAELEERHQKEQSQSGHGSDQMSDDDKDRVDRFKEEFRDKTDDGDRGQDRDIG